MKRVAVIGAGNIGRTHAGVYAADPLAKLVAICDVLPDRARALAEEHGAKAYTDVATMLREAELDAVSITTAGVENGGHHYEPAMQALEVGLDVLCEKPLSNDIAKARQMVVRARELNRRLGCNLNHRFAPAAAKAKARVEAGELGVPLFANINLWIRNPNESSPWFHLRALHPHSIDVLRYFAGDVRRVHCFALKAPGRQIWSTASINLQFASGAVGHLTGSYDMVVTHPIERCEVGGTRARFVIDNVYESLTWYPHDSDESVLFRNSMMAGMASFRDTFRNRIHRWLEQLEAGDTPSAIEGSGAEAVAAQEVVEAAILSLQEGRVVDLP